MTPTIDKPIVKHMPTLTLQQAHNGARQSAIVRKAQKVELVQLRARVAELERALPAMPAEQPKQNIPELVTRTREHIEAIDKMIADCSDAREMDALTRSREREFRIFAHCSNLPGPGNLKPSSPKQSRAMPVQPMPIPHEPSQSSPGAPAA